MDCTPLCDLPSNDDLQIWQFLNLQKNKKSEKCLESPKIPKKKKKKKKIP